MRIIWLAYGSSETDKRESGSRTHLLAASIEDSKEMGKCDLVILTGDKKRSFLADPKFLCHIGFSVADIAAPYYALYYRLFDSSAPKLQFTAPAKQPHIDEQGFVLYYSHQCPFTVKYAVDRKNRTEARCFVPLRSLYLSC